MSEECYVIVDKLGGYLRQGENSHLEVTKNPAGATLYKKESAHNILINSISPSEKNRWEIKKASDLGIKGIEEEIVIYKYQPKTYEKTMFDDLDFDFEDAANKIYIFYKDLLQFKTNLEERKIKVEKSICDIEHYIEFNKLSAVKGYKAYKMMHDYRIKRRKIKDNIFYVQAFLEGTDIESIAKGRVVKRIKGMEKRQYSPRVLNSLFK